MIWIKDYQDGNRIGETLLVTQVNKGTTTSNATFLTVILQDKTGSIEGKIWDIKQGMEQMIQPGVFLLVQGDVISYRSALQIKIDQVKLMNADSLDVSDFTMVAPIPLNTMEETLKQTILSIQDNDYRGLLSSLIEENYKEFIMFPAAVRNHHAFTSGLLYHSLSMVKLAEFFVQQYPPINRDLLVAGILLHDLGKTKELSGPVITKYTLEGKLLGHIHIMAAMIMEKAKLLHVPLEKAILLQHIILSHHGKPEFGSAIPPMTKEALLVHMIDDFDAKMTMIDKALESVEDGNFTARLFTFDDRSFYKPKN
jgi:3'-5' exoribonuclease